MRSQVAMRLAFSVGGLQKQQTLTIQSLFPCLQTRTILHDYQLYIISRVVKQLKSNEGPGWNKPAGHFKACCFLQKMLSNLFCVIPISLYSESGDVKTGRYQLLYFQALSAFSLIKVQICGTWNFCLPSDCKQTNPNKQCLLSPLDSRKAILTFSLKRMDSQKTFAYQVKRLLKLAINQMAFLFGIVKISPLWKKLDLNLGLWFMFYSY